MTINNNCKVFILKKSEDDLRKFKLEYLSIQKYDLTQILNFSLWRQPLMQNNLEMFKFDYIMAEIRGILECGSAQPSLFEEENLQFNQHSVLYPSQLCLNFHNWKQIYNNKQMTNKEE